LRYAQRDPALPGATRRVVVLAVDVLVVRSDRAPGDGARLALPPPRPPTPARAPAHRLAGPHGLRGPGGGDRDRLQLVSEVGWLDVERLCRDGHPVPHSARGPRGLARVGRESRRASETAAANPRLRPGHDNPRAHAPESGRRSDDRGHLRDRAARLPPGYG